LQTASDVLELLGEQAEAVLNDAEPGTVERVRLIHDAGRRGDAIEQQRLRDASPRRYESMLDTGRLESLYPADWRVRSLFMATGVSLMHGQT
jgi:hypothetical protein